MAKHKTHSGAKKRFKKLKSGKIKAAHAFRRHLLTKKSAKRKRQLREGFILSPNDSRRIVSLLAA